MCLFTEVILYMLFVGTKRSWSSTLKNNNILLNLLVRQIVTRLRAIEMYIIIIIIKTSSFLFSFFFFLSKRARFFYDR